MGGRHPRQRAPPGDRDELKKALLLVAHDPESRPAVPYRYMIDALERRYNQPPGSAESWPVEALARAIEYYRLEAGPRKRKK